MEKQAIQAENNVGKQRGQKICGMYREHWVIFFSGKWIELDEEHEMNIIPLSPFLGFFCLVESYWYLQN